MAVSVKGWRGVAFSVLGPSSHEEVTEYGWESIEDPGRVRVCMVGDDKVHIVDKDDCIEIPEEDYCHQCGQIGCTHDGMERL